MERKMTVVELTQETLSMIYSMQSNLRKMPQDFLMVVVSSMNKVTKESELQCEKMRDGSKFTNKEHAENMAMFFGSSLLLELLAQEVERRQMADISMN